MNDIIHNTANKLLNDPTFEGREDDRVRLIRAHTVARIAAHLRAEKMAAPAKVERIVPTKSSTGLNDWLRHNEGR